MAQLFHKDIGIPANLTGPSVGLQLVYSNHAIDQSIRKDITLPSFLSRYTLVEVEIDRKWIQKWVVRVHYSDQDDLVLVVQPDGFVRTVWLNSKTDTHKTLDRSQYARPEYYRSV